MKTDSPGLQLAIWGCRHFSAEAARKEYRATGYLDETADRTGVSSYKVRKLLITAGEWSSPFSDRVGALRAQGKSVAEIAAELGASANLITAYLPYEKSVYGVADWTPAAARSDHYRRRIRIASSRHIRPQAAASKPASQDANRQKGDSIVFGEDDPNPVQPARPIRLHLSLMDEDDEERESSLKGLSQKQLKTAERQPLHLCLASDFD